ncbi:unnamed protein product, partial [Fusarium graminearum]
MSLWLTVARRSLVVISHRMDVVLLGSNAYYGEIGLLFRSEANNPNETMGRQLSEPHIGVLSKQDAQDSILYPYYNSPSTGAGRSLERESWVPELAFQTQSTARWMRPELAPGTGGYGPGVFKGPTVGSNPHCLLVYPSKGNVHAWTSLESWKKWAKINKSL